MHYGWRTIIVVLTAVASCCFTIQARADSLSLPPALQQKLQQLQQQDLLEEWINAQLDYVDENPAQRLTLLMHLPQKAWRNYHTYRERLTWFDMLALQGYYQLQTGNILSSISAYENALHFYESYPLPDAQVIEYVLKPLGNNYTRLADYGLALHIHRKTLALAQKMGDRIQVASVLGNMAVCARWQGDSVMAVAYCREAMAQAGKGTAIAGLLLNTYADILTEQQQYDSAAWYCKRALDILQLHKGDEQHVYWYGSALQQMATIALYSKQPARAQAYVQQAIALYQQYYPASRQREKAKLQVLAGNVYLQTGHADAAMACFTQSLSLLLPGWQSHLQQPPAGDRLYGENTIGDALEGGAKSLQALGKKEDALQWFMVSLQAQHILRQEFFYTASKLREIAVTRSRADAAVALAYSLWEATGNRVYANQLLQITELSKAQVLLEERLSRKAGTSLLATGDSVQRKQRQLQQAITYYRHELLASGNNANMQKLLEQTEYQLALLQKEHRETIQQTDALQQQLPVTTLLAAIPQNVVALVFYEGANQHYLIEATTTGIGAIHRVSNQVLLSDSIVQFMQHWFARGPGAMFNAPETFYHHCAFIYQAVFANYTWKKGLRYLLVADGAFNYLPFDALVTADRFSNNYSQWPYLYKQAVISKAYSLQTWYSQQNMVYHQGGLSGFFVGINQQQSRVMLDNRKEYDMLSNEVKGRYFLDSLATYPTFVNEIAKAAVLHVSMHTSAQPEPMLQLYDAPFFLSDLQFTRFNPAIVVLSACGTAEGVLLKGEGVNSLERGFIAAGAGGVLGSLWNVNDNTAVELSALFYKQLARQPDAAMALYAARKEWLLLHNDNAVLQLPYYWATFEYSGHLQPVRLQSAWLWYYVLACVAVVTGVLSATGYVFYKKRKAMSV
ncbi:CHAT domain-containing protein [Filimonas lacunae]|uniref:CHAT domain-containing protein n=1 Tax=Filimonas lacunae TaxID=477680 RepID=A0A173MPY6_9BACT|nr:CHAT domain-containing tetratricopeptide repeat protein [Filimonas lacunae]BAV09547.1 hypothetical protein FLA_5598 [Filimonas lacunae]SIS75014.1 CHAT domain-containing protein [Filimonas lacunae]